MLELKRLVALREVARLGSFSAAADELSLTQSAVSQQIAQLERQLGLQLLHRTPGAIRLTEPGAALVERLESALGHLSAAEVELERFRGLRTGRLRVGAFASAGARLVPEALRRFRERHPGPVLTLRQLEPEAALAALVRGDLDLALTFEFGRVDGAASGAGGVARPGRSVELGSLDGAATGIPGVAASVSCGRGVPDGLACTPLFDEPVLAALPAGHRLASEPALRLGDLAGEPWVRALQAGLPFELLARWAEAEGFGPRVEFEGDDFATVLGLVAAGLGVALVPELALGRPPDGIALKSLDPPLVRRVQVVTLAARYTPPAVEAMIEMFREGHHAS